MNRPESQLDADLRALLREAMETANSSISLLRHSLDGRVHRAWERRRPLALDRTSIDRHLRDRYREEVAWLLYEEARIELLEAPKEVSRTHAGEGSPARLTLQSRRGALTKRGHAPPIPPPKSGDLQAVHDCVAGSLQLTDSDRSAVFLALLETLLGHGAVAERRLVEVLQHCSDETLRAYALCNLGLTRARRGALVEARDDYRSSARLSRSPTLAVLHWFECSLLTLERSSAIQASEHMGERPPTARETSEAIQMAREDARQGVWSAGARDLASLLLPELTMTARRYCAAILDA